jgi:hypothetical protein
MLSVTLSEPSCFCGLVAGIFATKALRFQGSQSSIFVHKSNKFGIPLTNKEAPLFSEALKNLLRLVNYD